MAARWAAVRWYRRASRECARRATEGAAIAALPADLRDTHRPDVLRQRYAVAGTGRAPGTAADPRLTAAGLRPATLRQVEDAAIGLRWLEIAGGLLVDPRTSLIPQLPAVPAVRGEAST